MANAREKQLELTFKFNDVTAVVTPEKRNRMLILCNDKGKEPVAASVQPIAMAVEEVEQLAANGPFNLGHALTTRQIDIDFDTDNLAAVAAFHYFLPMTPYRIGRKSKPDSHWIFNFVEDFHERANEFTHIIRFLANDFKLSGKPVKIEYRYRTHKDNDFNCRLPAENPYIFAPGSLHPSGDLIEWA